MADGRWVVEDGDCLERLQAMPSDSVDAMVTDPPAGIEFMDKSWDSFRDRPANPSGGQTAAWDDSGGKGGTRPFARRPTPRFTGKQGTRSLEIRDNFIREMTVRFVECLRVMKPGAHGVVWAIPRTSHWTAMALEDAGFEIRDVSVHLFGQGFPKSRDIAKALDKQFGGYGRHWERVRAEEVDADGYGTTLKPASEHWILVRKPFSGTVAENFLRHGTGAIHISATRVGESDAGGRWPANLTLQHHDECTDTGEKVAVVNDKRRIETKGQRGSGFVGTGHGSGDGLPGGNVHGTELVSVWDCHEDCPVRQLDEQTADRDTAYAGPVGVSRFFYTAKASPSERVAGLEGKNEHPTVKSVALMRWLCRLVTPRDGLIVDPFTGSGTTGIAAIMEGFRFHGIEQSEGHAADARDRIAFWERHGEAAPDVHRRMARTGQLGLL